MYMLQIRVEAPHKPVAVRPLTSHRSDHPSKTSKTCWTQLEK